MWENNQMACLGVQSWTSDSRRLLSIFNRARCEDNVLLSLSVCEHFTAFKSYRVLYKWDGEKEWKIKSQNMTMTSLKELSLQQKCCLWRHALCLLVSLYKKRGKKKENLGARRKHDTKTERLTSDRAQSNWYMSTNQASTQTQAVQTQTVKQKMQLHLSINWHAASLIIL